MSRLSIAILTPILAAAFVPSAASAQFYAPPPVQQAQFHSPGGVGLDFGLRNGGFNPALGAGIGPVGAGVGTGFGTHGVGAGANAGIGPIGASLDGGLGRNGVGLRSSAGIGNTGAAVEGGISEGGIGLGGNARIFGFGGGASLGFGDRGPGLGASLAFGPLGTLQIGSHRNSYPGARQTEAHVTPGQGNRYYTQQNFGNQPYFRTQPAQFRSAPVDYREIRMQPPRFITPVQPASAQHYPQYYASQPVYARPQTVYVRPQTVYAQPQQAYRACQAPWTC